MKNFIDYHFKLKKYENKQVINLAGKALEHFPDIKEKIKLQYGIPNFILDLLKINICECSEHDNCIWIYTKKELLKQ